MDAIRRTIVVALLMVFAAGASAAAASAAPPEYRLSWTPQQVSGIRDGIARGDALCNISSLVAGTVVGVATGGAPVAIGSAIGIGVGAAGLLCGHNDPKLRDAVDEAYWRKCGVDAYVTDGPLSYDASFRYVVCP